MTSNDHNTKSVSEKVYDYKIAKGLSSQKAAKTDIQSSSAKYLSTSRTDGPLKAIISTSKSKTDLRADTKR